jgi:hypothetical protein
MKTVKPLKVPEPCVIDELPEVVTAVDSVGAIVCTPDVTVDADGHIQNPIERWFVFVSAEGVRYVAGVKE